MHYQFQSHKEDLWNGTERLEQEAVLW
jgi:hypothetical protein